VSETMGSWRVGVWQWGLIRQAVAAVFACLRRLAPSSTCPSPGGPKAVVPSGRCPLLGDLAVVSPKYWTL